MGHRYWFFRSLSIVLFLFLLKCIERNNPWDPLNGCPAPFRKELHDQIDPVIDSCIFNIRRYGAIIKDYEVILDNIRKYNDSILNLNHKAILSIDSIRLLNDSIEQHNNSSDSCDIDFKKYIDTLQYYNLFTDINEIDNYKKSIKVDFLRVASLIASGNERCSPQGIYDSYFIDSVFDFISSNINMWDSLFNELENYNRTVSDTNELLITGYNRSIHEENEIIRSYNRSISRLMLYCSNKLHSDPDTLEALLPELLPGDTIYLDNVTIVAQLRFTNMGDSLAEPIVIVGSPFGNTVFDQADFFISASTNIEFHNLTFSGSQTAGAKLESGSGRIRFENCVFTNNRDYGLEIIESSVTMINCKIYHNSGTGIRVQSREENDHSLSAENILVVHNRAYGINTISAGLNLNKVTISDNGMGGIRLEVPNKPSVISNSLITYNTSFGIRRESSVEGIGFFTTSGTNFFGNNEAMQADSIYLKHNIPFMNVDPCYVNKDEDDYRIGEQSVLYGTETGYKY